MSSVAATRQPLFFGEFTVAAAKASDTQAESLQRALAKLVADVVAEDYLRAPRVLPNGGALVVKLFLRSTDTRQASTDLLDKAEEALATAEISGRLYQAQVREIVGF